MRMWGSRGMWRVKGARRLSLQEVGWALTLLLLGWCLLAAGGIVTPTASAASVPSLTIAQPRHAGHSVIGPVGANIVVSAAHLLPNDTYTLGYASNDIGCSAGFTDLAQSPVTVTADADGAFTTQIAWPVSANNVGTSYVLCAQEQTTGAVAFPSQDAFVVAASAAPALTLGAPDTSSTPSSGSASLAPGSTVQVSGSNFFGPTSTLTAYLSLFQAQTAADLQQHATQLTPDSQGSRFNAQANGTFHVTLKLPSIQETAYLYVVSTDGNTQYLPTLVASQQVTLTAASATPSPSATSTPTQTATPRATSTATRTRNTNGTGGNTSSGSRGTPASRNLPLIVGLGVASGILFILGLVLIATGAAGRR